MIRIKHFMDRALPTDGIRLWVEPVGVTRDLREWCNIHAVLSELGPPPALAAWLDRHPAGYELFVERYRQHLSHPRPLAAVRRIAELSGRAAVTLLHQSDDPTQNSATALAEIINNLPLRETSGRLGPLRWLYRILWHDAHELDAIRHYAPHEAI